MAPLPKTMKGILIEKTGGTEVLQYRTDLPIPVPKPGELLVKNDYIGINYIDTYFRTGLYKTSLPSVLGREASSHVISVGPPSTSSASHEPSSSPSGSRFSPGDRVVWMGPSSYAEYSTCAASSAFLIPQDISSADACAAFLQGATALSLTEEAHPVQRGEWVLVLAASGGVGGWLCQILRAKGAHTIATVGRREKVQAAREAGAETVLVEGEDDIQKIVLEKTSGEGVAAVFDGVGKDTFDRSLACLKRKGSMVSFGNSSGAVPPFSILTLASKNIKLTRPSLVNSIATTAELDYYGTELFRLIRDEKFQIKIHEIYPLKDVARAHADIESRKTVGKLLLKP